jgi:hypothetical protein
VGQRRVGAANSFPVAAKGRSLSGGSDITFTAPPTLFQAGLASSRAASENSSKSSINSRALIGFAI